MPAAVTTTTRDKRFTVETTYSTSKATGGLFFSVFDETSSGFCTFDWEAFNKVLYLFRKATIS